MAYVAKKRAKKPCVGELQHRVAVCSMNDVVNEAGELRLTRTIAFKQWAKIEEKAGSLFSRDGQPVVNEPRDRQTHTITIAIVPGTEISAGCWLYEDRVSLSPRWFKVVSVGEAAAINGVGRFWTLSCKLYERTDEITKPVDPAAPPAQPFTVAAPLPNGVRL